MCRSPTKEDTRSVGVAEEPTLIRWRNARAGVGGNKATCDVRDGGGGGGEGAVRCCGGRGRAMYDTRTDGGDEGASKIRGNRCGERAMRDARGGGRGHGDVPGGLRSAPLGPPIRHAQPHPATSTNDTRASARTGTLVHVPAGIQQGRKPPSRNQYNRSRSPTRRFGCGKSSSTSRMD